LAAVLLASACTSKSDTPADFNERPNQSAATIAECKSVVADWGTLVSDWNANPGSCNSDADCKMVTPELRCPDNGLNIQECYVATTAARQAELEPRIAGLRNRGCPLNCGVSSHSGCLLRTPKCESGTCKSQ
jgi:hypothetical protein